MSTGDILLYATVGAAMYVIICRLNKKRNVAREPNLYKNPEKGMSKQGVYHSFKTPGKTGVAHPTLQQDGDLNTLIAQKSYQAAEGDTAAQRWLIEHNIKRGLHVGGTGITGHLGIGGSDTSHLVPS